MDSSYEHFLLSSSELIRIFQTYTRNRNWEILLMLLYLSVSQHVSAPMGHPQVNTITILKHLWENYNQRICCDNDGFLKDSLTSTLCNFSLIYLFKINK
jgi:hypothetical protein